MEPLMDTKGALPMKQTTAARLWTDPALPMSSDFCRVSYALYRTGGDVGRIVATRNPDRKLLGVGGFIHDSLDLSDEAVTYMTETSRSRAPMFVMTKAGIGMLSNRYHLSAGLGLYLHIHTHPEAAARLINKGALGYGGQVDFLVSQRVRSAGSEVTAGDESAYPALLEAWQAVRDTPYSWFETDARDSLSLFQLQSGIRRLAAFAGCDLTFTIRKSDRDDAYTPQARVNCYRPLLLEGLLLCLLSEMRAYSATRGGVCRLETPVGQGRNGLALMLRYPVATKENAADDPFLDALHSHLSYVGELGGLDVWFSPELIPPRTQGGLPERAVMLDWMLDPTVLSTSDLKAHLRLMYGETSRVLPMDGEIPLP